MSSLHFKYLVLCSSLNFKFLTTTIWYFNLLIVSYKYKECKNLESNLGHLDSLENSLEVIRKLGNISLPVCIILISFNVYLLLLSVPVLGYSNSII